jgi:tetratricopeptide (TPR) repeat protein
VSTLSAVQLRKNAEQKQQRKGINEAAPLYMQAAAALCADERHAEAASMLQAALERHERRAKASAHSPRELRRALGAALAASRQTGAAIAEYEEYLKSGTPDAAALGALADLYVAAGKPNLAVERLRRGIDRSIAESDIPAAATAAGRVAALMPDSIDAAVQHVMLLRSAGDAGLLPALQHLAELYRANEKIAHEASVCREILTVAPDKPEVRTRLASLYTRILEMDPHDEEAWRGLRSADPELSDQLTVLLMDELTTSERARSKAG